MNMPVDLKSLEDSRKAHSGEYLKGRQGRSFTSSSVGLKAKQRLQLKLIDIPKAHGLLLRQGNTVLIMAGDLRPQVGINVLRKNDKTPK